MAAIYYSWLAVEVLWLEPGNWLDLCQAGQHPRRGLSDGLNTRHPLNKALFGKLILAMAQAAILFTPRFCGGGRRVLLLLWLLLLL